MVYVLHKWVGPPENDLRVGWGQVSRKVMEVLFYHSQGQV
jgi:hypothetical protein